MRSPEEWQSDPIYIYTRVQRARQAELYASAVDWLDKAHGRRCPTPPSGGTSAGRSSASCSRRARTKLAYRAAAGYTEGPDGRAGRSALPRRLDRALLPRRCGDGGNALRRDDGAFDAAGVGDAGELLARPRPARARQGRGGARRRSPSPPPTRRSTTASSRARRSGSRAPTSAAMPDAAGQRDRVRGARGDPRHPASRRQRREGRWRCPCSAALRRRLDTGAELLLAARLAQSLGAHNLAIIIAEDAEERGMPLDLFNFPKDGLPADAARRRSTRRRSMPSRGRRAGSRSTRSRAPARRG